MQPLLSLSLRSVVRQPHHAVDKELRCQLRRRRHSSGRFVGLLLVVAGVTADRRGGGVAAAYSSVSLSSRFKARRGRRCRPVATSYYGGVAVVIACSLDWGNVHMERSTQTNFSKNWVEDLYWKQLDLDYPGMDGAMVNFGAEDIQVMTFGQPRMGNAAFAAFTRNCRSMAGNNSISDHLTYYGGDHVDGFKTLILLDFKIQSN
nr:lipase-like isoform X2 [Ipomoea batatas]